MRERTQTTNLTWLDEPLLRVADIAAAVALTALLLPVIAFVAAVPRNADASHAPLWSAIQRFRGDQLSHLYAVIRGERSFFADSRARRPFGD